jgi:hypothetical protein
MSNVHHYTREEQYDMLANLATTVDSYFSPENLAWDFYLQQLLKQNGQNGISVTILANFPKVKELYDMAPWLPGLLSWAMAGSRVVRVSEDQKWIRPIQQAWDAMSSDAASVAWDDSSAASSYATPILSREDSKQSCLSCDMSSSMVQGNKKPVLFSIKSCVSTAPSSPSSQTTIASSARVSTLPYPKERTTVIVRDVPEDCDYEEVMESFPTSSVEPKSAYQDVANTWYIHFGTEEQAVDAIVATRGKQIHGQPIRAGIKSERTMAAGRSTTVRPLTKALEALGIADPEVVPTLPPPSLGIPELHGMPAQQLNVPHYAYEYTPYSGYSPYNTNSHWPHSYTMTSHYPSQKYSHAMPPHYPTQEYVYSHAMPSHYPSQEYAYSHAMPPQYPEMDGEEVPPHAMPPRYPYTHDRKAHPKPVQQAPYNKKHFLKRNGVYQYQSKSWKNGDPQRKRDSTSDEPKQAHVEQETGSENSDSQIVRNSERNEPQEANVEQKTRVTETSLTNRRSVDTRVRTNEKNNRRQGGEPKATKALNEERRQGSEPKAMKVVSQDQHFPALSEKKISRVKEPLGDAPKVGAYASALLNAGQTSSLTGESTLQTQQVKQAASKMNSSTDAAESIDPKSSDSQTQQVKEAAFTFFVSSDAVGSTTQESATSETQQLELSTDAAQATLQESATSGETQQPEQAASEMNFSTDAAMQEPATSKTQQSEQPASEMNISTDVVEATQQESATCSQTQQVKQTASRVNVSPAVASSQTHEFEQTLSGMSVSMDAAAESTVRERASRESLALKTLLGIITTSPTTLQVKQAASKRRMSTTDTAKSTLQTPATSPQTQQRNQAAPASKQNVSTNNAATPQRTFVRKGKDVERLLNLLGVTG